MLIGGGKHFSFLFRGGLQLKPEDTPLANGADDPIGRAVEIQDVFDNRKAQTVPMAARL